MAADSTLPPGVQLELARLRIDRKIGDEVIIRSYRASNELRNASQLVLRGSRSGKSYIVPGTGRMKYYKRKHTAKISYKRYTASAPGEPPAVRTGAFRAGWTREAEVLVATDKHAEVRAYIENNIRTPNGHLLGDYLENGTPGGKMAPRPHHDKIREKAMNNIMKIYKSPYF